MSLIQMIICVAILAIAVLCLVIALWELEKSKRLKNAVAKHFQLTNDKLARFDARLQSLEDKKEIDN